MTIEKAAHWLNKIMLNTRLLSLATVADNMIFIDDVQLKEILTILFVNRDVGKKGLIYTITLLGLQARETKRLSLEKTILILLASHDSTGVVSRMIDLESTEIASVKFIQWYRAVITSNNQQNKRHFLHFLRCFYYYTKNLTVKKLLDEDETCSVIEKNNTWFNKKFDLDLYQSYLLNPMNFSVMFISRFSGSGASSIIKRFFLKQFTSKILGTPSLSSLTSIRHQSLQSKTLNVFNTTSPIFFLSSSSTSAGHTTGSTLCFSLNSGLSYNHLTS